jgi:hypothetical protein
MGNPEKPQFESEFSEVSEKKEGPEKEPLERLEEYIRSISEKLREQGIFVDENGRINMDRFKGVYPRSNIEADEQYVKGRKEVFRRVEATKIESRFLFHTQEAKEKALREKKLSEICEMLVMAILHKNLKENFVVVRTSEYDDIRNGIDTVILDKNTGSIVCAVDEIDETSGLRLEEKKEKIMHKNRDRSGGFLKYGLYFEKGEGGMELKRGLVDNVPLFYYAISRDDLKSTLAEFLSSQTVSPTEKTIFESFLRSSLEQIDLLRNESLHPRLRENLELFERSISQYKMLKEEDVE